MEQCFVVEPEMVFNAGPHTESICMHYFDFAVMMHNGRVAMPGPIRQEVLSGIRETSSFEHLRDHLRAFPDEPLAAADYERAAECFDACRRTRTSGFEHGFPVVRRCRAPRCSDSDDR